MMKMETIPALKKWMQVWIHFQKKEIKNAVVFAKIYSLVHEADDGSGKLLMEIMEENSSKIVEFYKCESV